MMDTKKLKAILDRAMVIAKKYHDNETGRIFLAENFSEKQIDYITTIVDNIETQKSIFAVLITSLLKKIENPNQDIRLHRKEFKSGYSGRSLDTNVVTPWLKEHFQRFAPKESGWLTRSIEQPRPFTKKFPGKIRNKKVKIAFLSVLEDIEEKNANVENYFVSLLILLLDKIGEEIKTIEYLTKVKYGETISINLILQMLKEHFSTAQSSRLPVIAIYSIYQILSKTVQIYKEKELQPLKSHTTSDRYIGYGDVEVYYLDGKPFEIVEIKHNIPIDIITIKDILIKIKDSSIKRYFILTTAEPNFKGNEEEIFDFLNQIKRSYNIDIIPNGIIPSLKYYLRFITDVIEFVKIYTENLKKEFQQTIDIKKAHIKKWEEIIKKYSFYTNK